MGQRSRSIAIAVLVAVMTLCASIVIVPGTVAADAPQKGEASLNPQSDIETVIRTIEDPQKREELIRHLRILVEKSGPAEKKQDSWPAQIMEDVSKQLSTISRHIVNAAAAIVDIGTLKEKILIVWEDPAKRTGYLKIVAIVFAVFAAGLIFEYIARLLLRDSRKSVEEEASDGVGMSVMLLGTRTLLDLAPIAAFAAASFGALTLLESGALRAVFENGLVREGALALIIASVMARGVAAVARMLLTPNISALRMLPLNDQTANYTFLWVKRLANLTIYGFLFVHAGLLLGLPASVHVILLKLVGLAVVSLVIMFVLQNRNGVAGWIRGDGDVVLLSLRRRLSDVWHILLVIYILVGFAIWALEIPGGFEFILRASILTVLIVIVTRGLNSVAQSAIGRAFALGDELTQRFPELEERANRYLPMLKYGMRLLLYVIACLAILQAWGLDVVSWLTTQTGRSVVGRFVTITMIVLIALMAWEVVRAVIERFLMAQEKDGNKIERSQRVRTLLPLIRNVFMVVLIVLVSLTVLSELGINIGPLLAGAGVAGLAIGFGAQTLVKDVITGLFILLEDSISVGDVVDVASHTGVVEGLTIRTIRLRDIHGTVHTVPFSEVNSVKNLTKEFSFAVMEIGVAYREDMDHVFDVITRTGVELREDPKFAEVILEDLQIQGLDRFDDSAIVIRARVKTKPLQQWAVRRAFNKLLKQNFDAERIEIPFPHQTIYFGEDHDGNAPPMHLRHLKDKPKPSAPEKVKTAGAQPRSETLDTEFTPGTIEPEEGT